MPDDELDWGSMALADTAEEVADPQLFQSLLDVCSLMKAAVVHQQDCLILPFWIFGSHFCIHSSQEVLEAIPVIATCHQLEPDFALC